MFLFMILALIIVILTVITVIFISTFGAGFILIFGDVIVCIIILVWLIKHIFFK